MRKNLAKSSKKPLYLIILTCLLPVLLAHSLFYLGYGSHHRNSKGTLLTPPILLPTDTSSTWKIALLQTAQYNKPAQKIITKRWHALGKDQARVQLLILHPDDGTQHKQAPKSIIPPQSQWVEQAIPQQLWSQLTIQQSKQSKPCEQFILDPKNQVILCYDQSNLPRDIDLDLRKLLKWSRQ